MLSQGTLLPIDLPAHLVRRHRPTATTHESAPGSFTRFLASRDGECLALLPACFPRLVRALHSNTTVPLGLAFQTRLLRVHSADRCLLGYTRFPPADVSPDKSHLDDDHDDYGWLLRRLR